MYQKAFQVPSIPRPILTPHHRKMYILTSLLTWTDSTAQVQINQCSICQPYSRLAGSISLECEFIGLTLPTGQYFIWETTAGNSFQGWHHAWHPRVLQGWLLRAVINSACDQTSQKHIKMPLILSDCLPNKSGAIPRRTGESGQADSKRGVRALVVRRVITCLSYRIHVSHIWRNLVLAAHAAFKDTLNSLRINIA